MKEIELKILNINKEEILRRLRELGAKANPRVLVVEEAWDFKNHKISRQGNLVRLRSVGDVTEFAFKTYAEKNSAKSKFKIMDEFETAVEDIEAMREILKHMGLTVIKHREKYRTHLTIGETKFELDEYPTIPPYLEIEGSKESILHYVKLLGFSMKETKGWSATKVLKHYRVNPTHLVFKK